MISDLITAALVVGCWFGFDGLLLVAWTVWHSPTRRENCALAGEVQRLQNTVVALTHGLDFKDLQLKEERRRLAVAVSHPSARRVGVAPQRIAGEGTRLPTDFLDALR